MQIVSKDRGVVVSLDAYRERRKGTVPAQRDALKSDKTKRPVAVPRIETDEDGAEDTHRLLLMPTLHRPDERELL